jgi:predicted ArsR family transcriptional regulator
MNESQPLSLAKRRIVDALKRRRMTGPELAAQFGRTTEAMRQQLGDLADHGIIFSERRASNGVGRPAMEWALTDLALDLFPDRHADLTVSLIESIRRAVGEEGLEAVVAQRTAGQLKEYRRQLSGADDKLTALADLRTDEGYMAEVVDAPDGDGQLLIEHHCPVCDAAAACQGLCQSELELFQAALGTRVTVTRDQHLLTGDDRCVYRVR